MYQTFRSITMCLLTWVRLWSCGDVGIVVARSRVRLSAATTLHQRELGVPSLRGRLMSTVVVTAITGRCGIDLFLRLHAACSGTL